MIVSLAHGTETVALSEALPLLLYVASGFVLFAGGAAALVGLYRVLRVGPVLAPPTCRRCSQVVGSDADVGPIRCNECGIDLRGPDRIIRSRFVRVRVAAALVAAVTLILGGVAARGYYAVGLGAVTAVRESGDNARRGQQSAASSPQPRPGEAFRPSLWLAPALPPAGLVAMAQTEFAGMDLNKAHWAIMDGQRAPDLERRLRARVALDLLVAAVERQSPMAEVDLPIERLSMSVIGSGRVPLSDAVVATFAEGASQGIVDWQRLTAPARSVLAERGTPRVSVPSQVAPGSLVCAVVTRRDHPVNGWCAIDEILIDGVPAQIVASEGRADRALVAVCTPAALGTHDVVVRWRSGVAIPDPEERWSFPVPRGIDASAHSLAAVVGETRRQLHVAAEPPRLQRATDADDEPLRAGLGRVRLSVLGGGTGAGSRTAVLLRFSGNSLLAWDGSVEVEKDGAWVPVLTLDPSHGPLPLVSALLPIPRDALGEELRLRYTPRTLETSATLASVQCDASTVPPRAIERGAVSHVWSRTTVYTLRRGSYGGFFSGNDDCGEVLHE